MIKTFALGLLATAAVAAPAFAAESPRLQIEHAAARVVVIPEARGDIAYTVDAGRSGLPAIQVRREGDKLILDGGLKAAFGRSRIRGCDSYGASHVVDDRTSPSTSRSTPGSRRATRCSARSGRPTASASATAVAATGR
jgi:hypothetical protein